MMPGSLAESSIPDWEFKLRVTRVKKSRTRQMHQMLFAHTDPTKCVPDKLKNI